MYDLTISIVTYKNEVTELMQAVNSALNTTLNIRLYIIDNSPTNVLEKLFTDSRIEYIFNNVNIGYGSGHNIAIKKAIDQSKYHLVLNPDIYFEEGILKKIISFMNETKGVGLLMPKVCDLDGSIRRIRRLLPTPINVFGKLLPSSAWLKRKESEYRTEFIDYGLACSAPFLSGCFMFFRTSELIKVGNFDEQYFMYFEDADLSRRFYARSKTIYYPEVSIVHLANRESSRNVKLFYIHLKSAVQYFNKWGWLNDNERVFINYDIKNGNSKSTLV